MSWYVARSLEVLLAEVNASAPGRSKASDGSIGDESHSSRDSDHNPCDCHRAVCARDFTHDPAHGFDAHVFADWLVANVHREPRIKYVISDGRIASGQGQSHPAGVWRPYSGSNPHSHHTHVSVRHPQDLFDAGHGWGWNAAPSEPSPQEDEPMFCLVQADDGSGSIYRLSGAGLVPVPDMDALGGDQIVLASLGLDNTVRVVSAEYLRSWPVLR